MVFTASTVGVRKDCCYASNTTSWGKRRTSSAYKKNDIRQLLHRVKHCQTNPIKIQEPKVTRLFCSGVDESSAELLFFLSSILYDVSNDAIWSLYYLISAAFSLTIFCFCFFPALFAIISFCMGWNLSKTVLPVRRALLQIRWIMSLCFILPHRWLDCAQNQPDGRETKACGEICSVTINLKYKLNTLLDYILSSSTWHKFSRVKNINNKKERNSGRFSSSKEQENGTECRKMCY